MQDIDRYTGKLYNHKSEYVERCRRPDDEEVVSNGSSNHLGVEGVLIRDEVDELDYEAHGDHLPLLDVFADFFSL